MTYYYYPLAQWTTLGITGSDRAAWLNNLCTNDVRSLKPGEGSEAFVTDVKGKIVGHASVLATDDGLLLLTVPKQADVLLAHLERYVIREDVQLHDVSDAWSWFLLVGDDASERVRNTGLENILLYNADGLIGGGSLLRCTHADLTRVVDVLRGASISELDSRGFHELRVEAAWPLFGVDFNATNLPQEVARNEQAINFNKGCYLGQETIARIDALGHVNKQLAKLEFDSGEIPSAGLELKRDGENAGVVTTACWSTRQEKPLALAMLRRGASETGTTLQSEVGPAIVLA